MATVRQAPPILILTILSILLLGVIALWDERRESAAALDDFSVEQASLAREAAAALLAKLDALGPTPSDLTIERIAPAVSSVEVAGAVLVLLQRPGAPLLVTTQGKPVYAPTLQAELGHGARWVRLSREESSGLGLPARMAIAGVATAEAGPKGKWTIAVVATAVRVRDREARAMWRLVLGFGLTSALIAAFGFIAQRKQRGEVELARSLAVAEAMQTRDERLVSADKLATLGALATGIAHEVSTPLGVIVGRAEQLMPRVEGDERAKHSVEVIAEQAARIDRIVRAFLRLARGGVPSLERVSPAELAQAAVELVEHRFEKAHVVLEHSVADGLPRVACDPRLFEQVLVNLLLNACDACGEGAGHVELSVVATGDQVAFVVTDDGEGITPEVARRATEPFFTTKTEDAGTGLGLAIANEIVKHHHGDLVLEAGAGGRGTRATALLPRAAEDVPTSRS